MKKLSQLKRGLLAGAVVAAGGATFAFGGVPAGATSTPPQISLVTGHAGSATVTLGHPKPASAAAIDPTYVAYDPANGDEAIAQTAPGAVHVYLIAGANEANEYHIQTAPGVFSTLIAGDAYLVAGSGTAGFVTNPGNASTPTGGGSTTAAATANPIAPTSVTFDKSGNLLIAGHNGTGAFYASAVQVVAKAACSSTCPYGLTTLTAGNLYTVAGEGLHGFTPTQAIAFSFGVGGYGVTVDSQGNIVESDGGDIIFINEQATSVTRYGKTMLAHKATVIAGTGTTGAATCGTANTSVPATGGTSVNLQTSQPFVDGSDNVFLNDDNATTGLGCTWVLPATTGTFDGLSVTAGHLYDLAGGGASTKTGNGIAAVTAYLPNTSAVAVDPAGNLVLALAGTTDAVRVVAESNGTYYDQTMVKGDVYTISGGAAASGTTLPGDAAGFRLIGPSSLTTGAAGNLLLTDGVAASSDNLYQIDGAPTSAPSAATPTTTTLSATPTNTAEVGQAVTLTATVTPTAAAGSVKFYVATSVLLGTSTVSSGVATLITSSLPQGADSLTATFVPGNPSAYAGSTSSPVTYTVTSAPVTPGAETITATVPTEGALTLTVPSTAVVTLSAPTLTSTTLTETGTLEPVTVTDTRNTVPGWNVTGTLSNFTSGGNSFSGNDLGWTPAISSQSSGQTAQAGSAITAGASHGLHTGATWALAATGHGTGTASLSAPVSLVVPLSTHKGLYKALLTVTAI